MSGTAAPVPALGVPLSIYGVGERPRLLHERFAAEAAAAPERVAVVAGVERATYGALNARANRLARRLRALGAGPETVVALHLEPGIGAVTAVMAVLKAGAAYVPLDTRQPAPRIARILAAANARLAVTTTSLAPSLPDSVVTVRLDADAALIDALHDGDPAESPDPAALAVLFFTSGSTGVPKGVQTTHGGVAAAYRAWEEAYELRTTVRVHCQTTHWAFGVFHTDIWRALGSGGRLVLCPLDVVGDPPALWHTLRREGVHYAEFVPAALRPLVRWMAETGNRLDGVRLLVVGSDRWYVREHRQVLDLLGPATRFVHSFGLSEVGDVAWYSGDTVGLPEHQLVPIGRPFPGVPVHLVDGELRPVPEGAEGEMLIGGDGVTRGYLGRPALTAERYIPDPFSATPGARLYRTGDLARRPADGNVEFLGRADQQVKIRGFRIELGEVEAALARHPAVRECAAAAREDAPGERRLVAYVVPAPDAPPPTGAELRAFVAGSLPDYMVPAAYVLIPALPLGETGKVDRRALPAPPPDAGTGEFVPPRTAPEGVVAAVWAEVLGTERVGADDDFFALGGHSLLAVRVVSRLRDAFAVELGVAQLFEAPTVAGLAAAVERAREAGRAADGPLARAPRDRRLPLSHAQQRLWLLDQMDPGDPAYVVFSALPLPGDAEPRQVERALNEIVRRHESLRTTFALADGHAVQVIAPRLRLKLEIIDLRRVPPAQRAHQARRRMAEGAAWRFDLARGPLLRAALLRLRDGEQRLLLSMHHIVSDAWSMGVLRGELSELLAAYAAGREPDLPELPIQYADYAVWQRQRMQGAELQRQLDFWRQSLAGAPEALELPAETPRPSARTRAGAVRTRLVGAEVSAALRAVGRQEGATPFMVLLAGFAALLSRWTGADDLVVGTPVAGRDRSEVEGLIGFFVNTLPLRVGVDGDAPFRDLVRRVRAAVLQAQEHAEVPFERLVEELRPRREAGRNPIFQALFDYRALENGPRAEDFPGSAAPEDVPAAKFDVTLFAAEGPDGLALTWEYGREALDDRIAERMAASLETLLAAAGAEPDRAVGALPVMGADEERRTLSLLAGPRLEGADGACVHALFQAQARRTPDAAALVAAEGEVTYAALDARANRLAHALRERGVGPEARVAVALPRTPELVAALFGVLKAGGAYVPIDPNYPAERIALMLEDSGARVLVADAALAERLDEPRGIDILRIDTDRARIERQPETPVDGGVAPRNLAYVIYTSGSTGRPKGVQIEHRAASTFLHWYRGMLSDEERAAALGSTSVSFDVSIAELFGVLCWGGTLVLVENALSLAEPLPGGAEVTLATMVPSAAAELLRMGALPPSVRTLGLGGEPLPGDLASALHATGTVQRVLNLYGPTEDSTYTSAAEVGPDGRVRLGRPAANTRLYVLDRRLRPVPAGVAGELWISGGKLARGYLGQPALTAERFLPDPWGPAGSRMYRVMDRVRIDASGELEYLGRADQQLKVRGFRVEPGEIEAALRRHPAVREAAVAAQALDGAARLVGYVVADDEVAGAELRAFLRETLPEHMVPSVIMRLPQMPRLPNGKVNRRALPAVGPEREEGGELRAPRTPTEAALAGIWAEVLAIDHTGVEDDFFALGGHSLLATRVVSRVREALGAAVAVRDLFEAPVLADFAARVDAAAPDGAAPLVRVPRDRRLPLSHAQQRLWFLDQMEPGDPAYVIFSALPLPADAQPEQVERAINEIVRRHESLRTTFALADGHPVQVIAPRLSVTLQIADLRTLLPSQRAAEARRRVEEASAWRFDLARGPLLRAAMLRLRKDDQRLLLSMHHIVSDGWSMGVLRGELDELLAAYAAGREPDLPELPIQYADYAVWQRQRLQGGEMERQLGYWRQALAGAPEALELPAETPRPPARTHAGGVRTRFVDADVAARLRALGRQEGATPFMVLLAGFAALLSRWTGADDLVVGTPVAGRTRSEVERLIGFFVNTLPLRVGVDGDAPFRALVRRVRAAVLEAQGHAEVPFERLVEELRPRREPGRNPIFQVMFAPLDAAGAPGAATAAPSPEELAAADGTGTTSRFDLTLLAGDARGGGLALLCEYAADLFAPEMPARLLASLQTLLTAAAAEPDRAVADLPVMEADEERRTLALLSGPRLEGADGACVHALFGAQARRTPDAVALVAAEGEVTYASLDAYANRLAHALRDLAVGPEARVAVALPRTPELVAALFGVLKAGGAYVPIDPNYPAERIALMLEDSGARVLVADAALAERLGEPLGIDILRIDTDRARIERQPETAVDGGASPRNLAYVIYTSGSTGRPKGVQIEHRAASTFLHWYREMVSDEERAAALGSTSVSFDVSIAELFGVLCWGGTLVLVENALSLAEPLPGGAEVTLATMVPSAAAELLRMGTLPPSVRTLGLGGEPLPGDLASALHETGTVQRVLNLYGPTEDSTYTSAAEVGPDGRVRLGRPAANTRLYVLDRRLRPVPAGVAGELWISGDKLARGYLDQPALTAERFLPDPWGPAGSRMYRVMDRVRIDASGELEYLGRADQQLKVRGFRVEPGEVEAALRRHPAVREAAVAAQALDGAGWLAGYVVADDEVAGAELREFLRGTLPEHMIPSRIIHLREMPRLPNGKVDRRALPVPGPEREEGEELRAPRTPTEAALAALWAEVLGVDRVGVEDDFFLLGGHSLLATRVVSRVREAVGADVTVRDLFEAPVLANFAARVDEAREKLPAAERPILPAPRAGEVPLTYAQERLWLLDQLSPGAAALHVSTTIPCPTPVDTEALDRALTELVARHESLRTRFPAVEGRPRQEVLPPHPVRATVIDLAAQPDALEPRTEEETARPFDLRAGPLIRPVLFRLGRDGDQLLLVLHHLVCDGWSLGVLHGELAALYDAALRDAPSPLSPLPVQYADYAVWQRLRQDELEGEMEHWRSVLAGADLTPPLPADRPRTTAVARQGARYVFHVPVHVAEGVRRTAREQGATLFMALLAAFCTVLERRGGRSDLVVGTDVANRVRPETEGMVGLFTNQLALRVRLDGCEGWGDRVQRVRQATLDAFAHAELPFERLAAALLPDRPKDHAPVVQVKLVLENADVAPRRPSETAESTGDDAGAPPGHRAAAAQLDLVLFLAETPAGLDGSLVYDAGLFLPATAAALADEFEHLLRSVAEEAMEAAAA